MNTEALHEQGIWKQVKPNNYWTFQLGDDPELLHIVKLGWENIYAYFFEDGYELEPWYNGLNTATKEELEEKFKISLNVFSENDLL